jgi:hypothetical protein
MEPYADRRANGGRLMEWGRILAYITGTVDQELLLQALNQEDRHVEGSKRQ